MKEDFSSFRGENYESNVPELRTKSSLVTNSSISIKRKSSQVSHKQGDTPLGTEEPSRT